MLSKRWVIILMIIACLAQIAIPAMMIQNSEHILTNGVANKIRTAPIDPNDPFRGKYIRLDFDNNSIIVQQGEEWKRNEIVYATFGINAEGYAFVKAISKEPPTDTRNYIKTKILSAYTTSKSQANNKVVVDFPFDRFYMEESKAPKAEKLYNEQRIDSAAIVYALLMVEDGQFILKDVVYNGVSMSDVLEE